MAQGRPHQQHAGSSGGGLPIGLMVLAAAAGWYFLRPSDTSGRTNDSPRRAHRARAAAPAPAPALDLEPLTVTHPVDPQGLVRVGWGRPGEGMTGRNDRITRVGRTQRIPIEGFTSVRGWGDAGTGRAVLVVPSRVRFHEPVVVLVHLHGFGEGYRDRASGVRDVEYDRIAEQLEASGRQVVAVLPQGSRRSGFAPGRRGGDNSGFDVDRLVDEVRGAIRALQIVRHEPEVRGVIVSAHSGGGNPLIRDLSAGHGLSPARYPLLGVVLYDAINSERRMNDLTGWMRARIQGQAAALRKMRTRAERAQYISLQPAVYLAYGERGAYSARYGLTTAALHGDLDDLTGGRRLRRNTRERLWARYRVDAVSARSHSTIVGDGNRSNDGRRRYQPGMGTLERALSHILL